VGLRTNPVYYYRGLRSQLPAVIHSMFEYKKVQNSHFSNEYCADTTFFNSIYATSLKSYVFATATCSVELTTEDLIRCPYKNRASCESKFTFAHADFKTVARKYCSMTSVTNMFVIV
jgi:hypothetical protein